MLLAHRMEFRAGINSVQKPTKNRGCQITGDFLLLSKHDWLQATKSVRFHQQERKTDMFEMEKDESQKDWKRPAETVIITKIAAKL